MKYRKDLKKTMIPLIPLPKEFESGKKVKSSIKQTKERRKTMRLSKKARLMLRRKWSKPLIPIPEEYMAVTYKKTNRKEQVQKQEITNDSQG